MRRRAGLLAADRVYLLAKSPWLAVGSYFSRKASEEAKGTSQTNWAHSFHPYYAGMHSGIVSVALSLGSPPVAVGNCLVLCCPDFPLVASGAPSDHSVV